MDLPVSNGCSWWSDRGEIEMFTSIQLQIILDPSLYSFCILWFINSICYRWRNEYRKRKNFYWRESAIGFVLFTGINAPLIVFQEEKQVQLVIFIDGSLLIKNECLFIATGCNWLPSREGEGGVSYSRLYNHPNQSH